MKNLRNKLLGQIGEEIAAKYLKSQGLRIIERNFRKRYSELDIVATGDSTLVFVEVKTRIGSKFGLPEEAITPWKLKSLVRSAQYYNLLHPPKSGSMRIDVISIILTVNHEIERLKWIKNITG
mgnify:CR=1 FL=1